MPRKRVVARKKRRDWKLPVVVVVVLLAVGAGAGVWLAAGGDEAPGLSEDYAGTAMAGGVEVLRPAIDLGRQPLDLPVSHTFVLTNTNERAVQLGKANIEVLDGC